MGLRSYYFGFAVLTWLLNPWLMMGVTTFVVGILYQREFRSRTLTALLQAAQIQHAPVPGVNAEPESYLPVDKPRSKAARQF